MDFINLPSCIIFFLTIIKINNAVPIDNRLTSSAANSVDNYEQIEAFFYPTKIQHEVMKSSASSYYTSNGEDDYSDYSDYSTGTLTPSPQHFESEKILKKPSDIKKISLNTSNVSNVHDEIADKPNNTQVSPSFTASRPPNLEMANGDRTNDNTNTFSKLLFSSPSATVTSNGPSGPFKAIICHDCENSGGVNAGHYSVSFSAIKSWNVGNSAKSNSSELKAPIDEIAVEQASKNDDANVKNQGSAEITVNDSKKNEWTYSELKGENEKIDVNGEAITATESSSSSHPSVTSKIGQKKPIFNDLLKVPYDILNAPLSETSITEPAKNTQIHINHQQKINDTISNYHHFQHIIQKSPQQTPSTSGHYKSTPMPEQNYEVDESVSLMTNGRAHGIQSTSPRTPIIHAQAGVEGQDAKFGVVFEGRDFRKYKVEEKTADGFIVGEYGYLHSDGSPLFGVRYTADSNINPQLIYDALLKFIKL